MMSQQVKQDADVVEGVEEGDHGDRRERDDDPAAIVRAFDALAVQGIVPPGL